ncbi:hypothetical protein DEO72_LG11g2227 [Vigna unguiculata]|uniref:Uncharacterized protein n=1 Tax=Vigna unguiculata TaxID=3917 RepID=A0A4D6NPH3_VIGUN|nr:hypothetical protein DEO72_LG11g2227 [Vigna unguiculata]
MEDGVEDGVARKQIRSLRALLGRRTVCTGEEDCMEALGEQREKKDEECVEVRRLCGKKRTTMG